MAQGEKRRGLRGAERGAEGSREEREAESRRGVHAEVQQREREREGKEDTWRERDAHASATWQSVAYTNRAEASESGNSE